MRDSGPWAKEKLYYVERYLHIFNGGMKNKEGLNDTFETIRGLVDDGRPIDLIFTFQVTDLTRNVDSALDVLVRRIDVKQIDIDLTKMVRGRRQRSGRSSASGRSVRSNQLGKVFGNLSAIRSA